MPEISPDTDVAAPFGPGADSAGELRFAAIENLSTDDLALQLQEVGVQKRKRFSVVAWLAFGWMALVVGAAILAPVLPLDDPDTLNAECVNADFGTQFSEGHYLGCDGIGRDLLSRNIWGARSSLFVALGATAVGFLVGGGLGLIGGYYRGRLDGFLSSAFDVLLAFPALVLALTLVAVFATAPLGQTVSSQRRLVVLVIALGIVSIPIVARIARANTLTWAQREFVMAARAQGAKNRRIIWREVLPNVLPAMFSISLLGVAVIIVAEGGLSVLGLGVQLPTPSWGNIISSGRQDLEDSPWIVFGASMFIFLTVLALNFLGDVVRERFDVRESAL